MNGPGDLPRDVSSTGATDGGALGHVPVDAGSMVSLVLPEGVEQVRVTDRFDPDTVPKGLQNAHRVATGVWGELCVFSGEVTFAFEETGARRVVGEGEHQVIPPDMYHHVEPGDGATFEVRFHK